MSAEPFERLRHDMHALVDQGMIPGFVATVVERGEVLYLEAAGCQDPATAVPMAEDSLLRIQSLTKPIVSVAAMALCERGHLALDDPVHRHLPYLAQVRVATAQGAMTRAKSAIRVRHLLAHTAGFCHEFLAPPALRRLYELAGLDDPRLSGAELSRAIAQLPLAHEAGVAWQYGRATDVLGHLLEVICRSPLGDVLAELIFEPLGMRDTHFVVPAGKAGRLAQPFPCDHRTGMPAPMDDVTDVKRGEHGGSALVSTLPDYVRFVQMLCQEGRRAGVRVLRSPTLRQMLEDQVGARPVLVDVLPPGHGFGLGFAVCQRALPGLHPFTPGCYGWRGVAGTAFFVDPHRQRFGVVMTQAAHARSAVTDRFASAAMAG